MSDDGPEEAKASVSFLICKMEIITVGTSESCWENPARELCKSKHHIAGI